MLNLRIGRLDRLLAKCRKRQEAAGQSKDEDSAARTALPIVSLSIALDQRFRLYSSVATRRALWPSFSYTDLLKE